MKQPRIDPGAHVLPGAVVVGDVQIGEGCGIWYNAVVRGDSGHICIGNRTNVQDNCVLHAEAQYPLHLGNDVTVGHGCILHGCTVEDGALIGQGSIVMNGALVQKGAMLGAGSLVTQGAVIPAGTLAFGRPARVARSLSPQEVQHNLDNASEYTVMIKAHV